MSRLLNNSEKLREQLESRNLYSPEDPYDANTSGTVNAINNIVNVINPFGSFDLTNTVVGRSVGNDTPLARIGLQMLSIQFGRTAASNATAEFFPTINIGNLFDGDPNTKLFNPKVDFQITRRETQNNIEKILEEITGNYPLKGNPFPKADVGLLNVNSNIMINNTGTGQLSLLLNQLNRNRNKPSSNAFIDALSNQGFTGYADLKNISSKTFFSGDDSTFKPFSQYKTSNNSVSINERLNREINTYRQTNQGEQFELEYGSNENFVNNLGITSKFTNNNSSEFVFKQLGSDDQLIWGIHGTTNEYESENSYDKPFEGVVPNENGERVPNNPRFNFDSNVDKFNLKAGGLLSYTRELLNLKGKYSSFDLTKKKFIDTDEQLHFNGSPLTRTNRNEIDKSRQHTVEDPYNAFIKAIRYNGNKIYNGNNNSVIFDRVIPRITPENGINRNLMFSIENLAVQVTGDDSVAYVQDGESRTDLPLCERGANGGRLMWFPPYGIEISENVVVNRTTTNFIGRGEPIYTYNNTERIASLSFKLIIDYPPQVRDHKSKIEEAQFFAFGGEIPSSVLSLDDKIKKREDLQEQYNQIKPTKSQAPPQINDQEGNFYFPNDIPKIGSESGSVNDILTRQFYEVTSPQNNDATNFGLNDNFVNNFDVYILEYLADEEIRPYIRIDISATASPLFNGNDPDEYNRLLSERRVNALKSYIEERYRVLTGKRLDTNGLYGSLSALGAVNDPAADEASEISNVSSKLARRAFFNFTYNGLIPTTEPEFTQKEIQDRNRIKEQIEILDKEINAITTKNARISGCDFTPYNINDGIVEKYNSSSGSEGNNTDPKRPFKFKPAFYSQTPEDFHRRLTFLQQCTRQGAAVRKERGGNNDTNTFSANNSVFGRQPVQILRIGDFFHTKVIIDNMQIDYTDAPWDMNPEGMGMQFMIADVKLQLKLIGGQSLQTPIAALQNALSYNYYANSTFYNTGVYKTATEAEDAQIEANNELSRLRKQADKRKANDANEDVPAQNNTNNTIPNT